MFCQEPELRTVPEIIEKYPLRKADCVQNLYRNIEVSSVQHQLGNYPLKKNILRINVCHQNSWYSFYIELFQECISIFSTEHILITIRLQFTLSY